MIKEKYSIEVSLIYGGRIGGRYHVRNVMLFVQNFLIAIRYDKHGSCDYKASKYEGRPMDTIPAN